MKTKEFSVRIEPKLAAWVKDQEFSASELLMRIGSAGYHGKLNLAVPDPGAGSERITVRLTPRALSALREMTGSRKSLIALRRTFAAGASGRLLPPAPAPAPKVLTPRPQPGQIEREGVRAIRPMPETSPGSILRDPEPLEPGPVSGASLSGWATGLSLSSYGESAAPASRVENESPVSQLWADLLWNPAFYVLVACIIYGLYKWLFAGGSVAGITAGAAAVPVAPDVPWNPQAFSEITKGVWQ